MISATEALNKLREGNQRFASGDRIRGSHTPQEFLDELVAEQTPFAVVLGCSDSRVPAEIVFDQGLGDLFVIRVAGNIVMPSQIGSVEFAVEQCGSKLVVVMGHTGCGAVEATVEELQQPDESRSPGLHTIVNQIRPAIEPLLANDQGEPSASLVRRGVRANIGLSVDNLCKNSELIRQRIAAGQVLVVGAEYSLETRLVEFFDGGL
jgi:carbonic anhydrase